MSKPTRGIRGLPIPILLCFLISGAIACTGEETPPPGAATRAETTKESSPGTATGETHDHGPQASSTTSARALKAKGEKAARNPNERPVPAFEGTTIAGTRLSMSSLLGARVLLFFFNPEADESAPVSAAVNALVPDALDHNIRVVGIGVGSNAATLSRFAKDGGLDFPVIDDSGGKITQLLRLNAAVAAVGVDADGYMTFGFAGFPKDGDLRAFADKELRSRLRLSATVADGKGALYGYPQAPELGVIAMSTGQSLETKELQGRAAIVIFFLHTCPHCHRALEAIKGILDSIPPEQRPRLVAVSIQNSPSALRKSLADLGLDFFDPFLDPSGKATDRWGVTGGVPVVAVVDSEGRVRHRSQGWNGQRDGGLLRLHASRAAGAPAPMLLEAKGFSGNDACGACHEQEHAAWQYTKHATAFETLVAHAADRRTDCIGCHVVGFEERGGYDFSRRPAHLENVGCESCHGRGGPHLSPDFVPRGEDSKRDYAQVCATCHNPTHSLGFDFTSFHPRVSHKRIASLSNEERSQLLEGGGPSRDLLPTSADYVGSEACQVCHESEFKTWQASPHGHSVATLEKTGQAGEEGCLECHTTAYGRPGGFPPGAPVSAQSDLARVGCESCHGPGSEHIGESARRVGTILSLGDKCDSCVILKVCGTCHDDANDAGFQFEVEERIEAQRHGTIEAAATREGSSAFHTPEHRPGRPDGTDTRHPTPSRHGDRAHLQAAFGLLRARDDAREPASPLPVADAG